MPIDLLAGQDNTGTPVDLLENTSDRYPNAQFGDFNIPETTWDSLKPLVTIPATFLTMPGTFLAAGYKGIGTLLLREIVKIAQEQDYHVLVGGIDASNQESIRLHEKEGFVFNGIIREAGFKFGRWLDLAFYQLILKTPLNPNEDN